MHRDPDDELEELLRRVAERVDPVPPWLLQAAIDCFTWRTVDADLAELVFDSLAEQGEEVLVRGTERGRLLTFQTTGLTIDLQVTGAGRSRRLIGQLVPPQRGAVELRQGDDVATLEADELGRFSAASLRTGPVRLRCTTGAKSGGRRVVTDWISI